MDYDPLALTPARRMQPRLRVLMTVTALSYAIWLSTALVFRHRFSLLEIIGHAVLGMLIGVFFVYLADDARDQLAWGDLPANLLLGGIMFGVFALFATQALDWRLMLFTTLRGGGFGAIMWGLGFVQAGMRSGLQRRYASAAFVLLASLFLAPIIANAIFDGAVFFVVAVGFRLIGGLTFSYLTLRQQGFIFGWVMGFLMILIPFLGYYGYGAL